jgi:23S rRNA (uracil1939-C5)-methyltransferase
MNTVQITDLAWGGQGLGRIGGKVVFVPFSLPGEVVEIELISSKKNFSQGRLLRVLEPSANRIEAPCALYQACGGCQLQHLSPLKQIQEKERLFKQNLNHSLQGMEIPIKPVLSSSLAFGYRHRLHLKSAWEKKRFNVGLFRADSHEVVPITRCLLANEAVNQVLTGLQETIQNFQFTDWTPEIELQFFGNPVKGGLVFFSRRGLTSDRMKRITREIRKSFRLDYILFQDPNEPMWKSAAPFSAEEDSPEFDLPASETGLPHDLFLSCFPRVFSQINLTLNQRLIMELIKMNLFDRQDRILDLYCGLGNFSLPLSLLVEEVIGLEISPLAVENARWNQRRNQITNCTFWGVKAEEGLPKIGKRGKPISKIFLDPPRSGAREAIPWLDTRALDGILYLSCNPMTLFRDLKSLVERGWKVEWTQAVDFFPQTYHLESLTCLSRP